MNVHNLTFRIYETEKVRFRTILIYREQQLSSYERFRRKTCWENLLRNKFQKIKQNTKIHLSVKILNQVYFGFFYKFCRDP